MSTQHTPAKRIHSHRIGRLLVAVGALAVAGLARSETNLLSFAGPDDLKAWQWQVSGGVTRDAAQARAAGGTSLRLEPGARAAFRFREAADAGAITFWVFEEAKAPADPRKHAAGPMWGLLQRESAEFTVGAIYAPYLSGDKTYAAADCDPTKQEHAWQQVQYLGLNRNPGWHKWTFDFDADAGLRIRYDDKDVNASRPVFNWQTIRLKGVNGLVLYGDQSDAKQTLWVADVAIVPGPPMRVQALWPPPPPKDLAVVPPPPAQTGTPLACWARAPWNDPAFFPIAVWLQEPKNAARYKAAGINLYIGLWKGPTEEQLAALKEAGMPVICEQNDVGLKHVDDPLIAAWMHGGDEPDNAQSFKEYWKSDVARLREAWPENENFKSLGPDNPYRGYGPPVPPRWIVRDYETIRAKDPTRPVIINFGQGVAWEQYGGRGERTGKLEDYPEYVKGCDIVSYDIYPASHDHGEIAGNLWYVAQGIARLRRATGDRKPVWNCIECTRVETGIKPTVDQVRSEVWISLIHGSRGLIYFVHEFKPKFVEAGLLADEQMLAAVTAINSQIRELAPVLNSPTIPDGVRVVSKNPLTPVHAIVKRQGGATWLFAAGMYRRDTVATFTLPGVGTATAEVLGENRSVPVRNGVIEDAFAGYAVHLYKIAGAH